MTLELNSGSVASVNNGVCGDGPKPTRVRVKFAGSLLVAAGAIYLCVALYHAELKRLPPGLSLAGERHPVASSDVEFLQDLTAVKAGQRVCEQRIFDRVLEVIRQAQDFILVDLFLFNDYLGKDPSVYRKLCRQVSDALLERKRGRPGIHIVVITDPINEVYGGSVPTHFRELRQAGIPVIPTNLARLRDSNPLYSALWRLGVRWCGNGEGGLMPHPFAADAGRVSLRSWLALVNFKANHRKLVVADAPAAGGVRQMVSIVMSANPHDASSAHSNVGLLVRDGVWRDLLRGEQAIVSMSGAGLDLDSMLPAYARRVTDTNRDARELAGEVQVVTESKIRAALLEIVAAAGKGDSVDVAMFYLSERGVVRAFLDAAARGADIRVVLDPNRDAFGYQKNGIPNRPVGAELAERSGGKIAVRWFDTHGEQFHTKMVLVRRAGRVMLLLGSANLTRRNIGDFNLETDLVVTGSPAFPALRDAQGYFERVWANVDSDCTLPFSAYAPTTGRGHWRYRFQEWSGLSTF